MSIEKDSSTGTATADVTALKRSQPSSAGKGFKDALQYASTNWFPANPESLRFVQQQARAGAYDSNRTALFQDLKKDIALYAATLRRLGELISKEDASKHPVKILRHIDPDTLRKLLTFNEETFSAHRFEFTDELQAVRLRHAVISSGTAELLASKSDFDPEVVYSCALLRQVGFIIAAYSYPRTFSKALATVSSTNNNLELALFRYLGFSPTLLGVRSTIDWSSCPSLLIGVGIDGVAGPDRVATPPILDEELRYTSESIASFCELGECFARLNDPKHYAVSGKEFERVTQQLEHILGPKAAQLIQERISSLGSIYTAISPKVFAVDLAQRSAPRGGMCAHAKRLFESNQSVQKLATQYRDTFKRVYEHIEGAAVSLEATAVLINRVIPSLGFGSGCVYMADADNVALIPRLKIGPVSLDKFKALQWSKSSPISHPVLEAVSCSVPIKQENVFMYGNIVSHVTGVFGTREKVGVLYLEMTPELAAQDAHLPLLLFKAARQTLNDCLNLRE